MCGRYVLSANPATVQRTFDLEDIPDLAPRYNIAPTQPISIITDAAPKRLTLVQWGLVPSWSKDPGIGSRMFNARCETLAEKPSFRNAFKRRRCLVPADGFYEWMKDGRKKRPFFIHMKSREVFAFAGLWDTWQGAEGSEIDSCTIITTEPNALIRPLHNRMAVILHDNDYEAWLDPETPQPVLMSMLQPYPAEAMAAYEVSPAVGNYRNEGPELIKPFTPPIQGQLL